MKVSTLFSKIKEFSSFTLYEQLDGTYKGTGHIRATNNSKTVKYKSLDFDVDNIEFKSDFDANKVYACIKHPNFENNKFYVNVYKNRRYTKVIQRELQVIKTSSTIPGSILHDYNKWIQDQLENLDCGVYTMEFECYNRVITIDFKIFEV